MRNDAGRLDAHPPRAIRGAGRLGALALATLTAFTLGGCGSSLDPNASGDALAIELLVISPQSRFGDQVIELDGATVAGSVTVFVREHARITGVAFFLDDPQREGTPAHVSETAPHEFTLDTTGLRDGLHTLTAATIVRAGRPESVTATFAVNNTADQAGGTNPFGFPVAAAPPATLYVSPDGDDANHGRSADAPLRTVQRAADIVRPGDVVYLRGGTYPIQVGFNVSGTAEQPIVWTSFPGEWAVFDGSDQVPVESGHRVWVTDVSWNVFMNFEVRNSPREGIWLNNAHDNVFSHLITHGNHYSGITNYMSNRNRFEYIVTYDNYDRYNPGGRPGDDADGISIHTGDSNVVYRTVSFNNSDDGIDAWRSTNTIIDSCISFANGRGTYGNGNGIKGGGNYEANHTLVRNTLAFGNRSNGFDYNSGQHVVFVNNTAADNGGNDYVADSSTVLYNNVSVGGRLSIWGAASAANTWDLLIEDAAFLSIDPAHPGFLSLASDSPAIDVGRDVGLSYTGAAPDVGALEFGRRYADLIWPLDLTSVVTYAGMDLGSMVLAAAR